jgi:hypothetical protein
VALQLFNILYHTSSSIWTSLTNHFLVTNTQHPFIEWTQIAPKLRTGKTMGEKQQKSREYLGIGGIAKGTHAYYPNNTRATKVSSATMLAQRTKEGEGGRWTPWTHGARKNYNELYASLLPIIAPCMWFKDWPAACLALLRSRSSLICAQRFCNAVLESISSANSL